jgi:hypothetical protein
MPQLFNIGRDATVSIIANAAPLNPLIITHFSYQQVAITLKSRPLNAPPVNQKVPDGWEGELEYDRGSVVLDQYFATEEALYWAGSDYVPITILASVKDPSSGAINQFRFDNVILVYESGGSYKSDDKVSQRVKWHATTMTQVS